jgi:hypothetical protein
MVYIQVVPIFWHTLQSPYSGAVIWKETLNQFMDITVRMRLRLWSIVVSSGEGHAGYEEGLEKKSDLSLVEVVRVIDCFDGSADDAEMVRMDVFLVSRFAEIDPVFGFGGMFWYC